MTCASAPSQPLEASTPSVSEEDKRTYAGVLGKIIGVYFGRPVEGWTYERLQREYGEILYYPNKAPEPLVVPDDDISGTFVFIRALRDSWGKEPFSPQTVANAWLNYIIEDKTVLWWGGLSRSTEHTAFLRLKRGIPAPQSGSTELNGRAMSEQVGAQIFIDGWGLVNPGEPERAAGMARHAASVSHDDLAVDAACLVAAVEAMAYRERNLEKLLRVGLEVVGSEPLNRLVESVVQRCTRTDDWRSVRDWIAEHHGYERYPGNSPVATNHAAVVMSLLMAGDNFQRALTICTSAGWDTDSNAGNVGCINGVRLGLDGIDAGVDLRAAVADRLFVVSAEGGECVSDAVRETRKLVHAAALLRGHQPAKDLPRFAFEFPGATQGFLPRSDGMAASALTRLYGDGTGLVLQYRALAPGSTAAVAVSTFVPPAPHGRPGTSYFEVVGSPSLYPGQEVRAVVAVEEGAPPAMALFIETYSDDGVVHKTCGATELLVRGVNRLQWTVPDTGGRPVYRLGLELFSDVRVDGTVRVMSIDWRGAPLQFTLGRAEEMSPTLTPWTTDTVWLRTFVSSAANFAPDYTTTFSISHPYDNGVVTTGTCDWDDYLVTSRLTLNQQEAAGLVARALGHRRYYAGLLGTGRASIVKRYDGTQTVLASVPLEVQAGQVCDLALSVVGNAIGFSVDEEVVLSGVDEDLRCGGAGFVVDAGGVLADWFAVQRRGAGLG